MNPSRRDVLLALSSALGATGSALGQDAYPSRVIKVIVPSVPGGATDIIGRIAANGLGKGLGQTTIVENKPGAGTSLGAEFVAKAAPDGYTLLIGGIASHAINPAVYKNLGYDPLKSFSPITLLGTLPNVLLAGPSFPASNVKELVALLRSKPGKYVYASVGNGTSPHLSAELLWQMTGVRIDHIPYKGSAPALSDLLGGQVPLLFDNISGGLQFVREGRLKSLGVTSAVRSPQLPSVPTFAEAGIAGYELSSWAGLFGPAGLTEQVIKRISAAAIALLKDPENVRQLAAAGVTAAPSQPDEFAAFVAAQSTKFRVIAHRANLQLG